MLNASLHAYRNILTSNQLSKHSDVLLTESWAATQATQTTVGMAMLMTAAQDSQGSGFELELGRALKHKGSGGSVRRDEVDWVREEI
eukprot:414937-Hanusia_phi.AAC.5